MIVMELFQKQQKCDKVQHNDWGSVPLLILYYLDIIYSCSSVHSKCLQMLGTEGESKKWQKVIESGVVYDEMSMQ